MARRPVPIKVKSKDLKTIGQLIKRGVHQARVFMRALALRQLGQGITAPQVAAALPLTPKAIREIAHRYNSNGLEAAFYYKLFFFNDTATTEIYTLSLHDALPIGVVVGQVNDRR